MKEKDPPVQSLTAEGLKTASTVDPVLTQVVEHIETGKWPKPGQVPPELIPFSRIKESFTVVDGCLFRDKQLIPPADRRRENLETAHRPLRDFAIQTEPAADLLVGPDVVRG
ncbi:MAG: hypothetical protein GY696_13915 [Gammaproteobacteria bacterium]|nr:hypothetical protein [Gammaproteobacteria bacterium]